MSLQYKFPHNTDVIISLYTEENDSHKTKKLQHSMQLSKHHLRPATATTLLDYEKFIYDVKWVARTAELAAYDHQHIKQFFK